MSTTLTPQRLLEESLVQLDLLKRRLRAARLKVVNSTGSHRHELVCKLADLDTRRGELVRRLDTAHGEVSEHWGAAEEDLCAALDDFLGRAGRSLKEARQ